MSGGRPGRAQFAAAKQWWSQLTLRDRRMIAAGAGVLALYLVWAVALAPALTTLRRAPAELATLQAQEQRMQALAQVAQALRGVRPVPPAQAAQALNTATARLGAQARISVQGERAVLTLQGVAAPQIMAWLAEVRAGARARVSQAALTQSAPGMFSGTVTVVIGGASS